MPSIYTSVLDNVTQVNNESDLSFGVQLYNGSETATPSQIVLRSLYTMMATSAISAPLRKGLSGVAIFFIIFGVAIFLISLCVVICYIYRRQKHRGSPPLLSAFKPSVPSVTSKSSHKKRSTTPVGRSPPESHHARPRRTRSAEISLLLPKISSSLQCRKPLCEEYLRRFSLPDGYFAEKYDKCFCKKCHDTSNPDIKQQCGYWCTDFHGWTRFGLRVNEAHKKEWNIFQEWKTSFYGTSPNWLLSILRNRFVPFDDDSLADGTTFSSGHPDQTLCNTSSSLARASQPTFTSRFNFKATDGSNYYVQVVLQCKQQPGGLIIKGDTKSPKSVDWGTKGRCSVVPFGLLIRLQKM